MKIVGAILLLVLLVTGSAFGQWQKDGKRAEDTPESKSVKGFGGRRKPARVGPLISACPAFFSCSRHFQLSESTSA
jgi:hypothetical protein